MQYREFKPDGSMARSIKCYWILEDPSPSAEAQRIVPDGRPELIFNLGQPFESLVNGQWRRQPQSFIAGQITRPILLRSSGPAKVLGIRFHPHGAHHILGLPLHELTDSVVALDDVSVRLHQRLQSLGEPETPGDHLATLDHAINELSQSDRDDKLLSAAIAKFERSGGSVDVARVADQLGLSSRQLQRRFHDAVGISPKLFSRMQRFQRVFQAMEAQTMESERLDWVNTAMDCGYYDQAHLIRDFREFSGKAPTALLAGELDLARQFAQSAARP